MWLVGIFLFLISSSAGHDSEARPDLKFKIGGFFEALCDIFGTS